MTSFVAGLDFGTSNSAIGIATATSQELHRFAGGAQAVPTALFHDDEEMVLVCGREAEERFLEGYEGRYLRALKSILGTSLASESTRMGRKSWPFKALLVRFIKELKDSLEKATGQEVTHLVAGRPVRFVDESDERDAEAESQLREVLTESGFTDIEFVYEPVAALIDAEDLMDSPEIVLVADIGGGTSDFTLARREPDGRFEVLANHGVHIGGTDLDRQLSLKAVMPHFGYGTEMRSVTSDTILPVPPGYYSDLATWQKIHFCYAPAIVREVRTVQRQALEPEKLGHLLTILDQQLGHRLANAVERVKIALSDAPTARLGFTDIRAIPAIDVDQAALSQYFQTPLSRVAQAARETLAMADIDPDSVGHIVLTGGSTLLPDIRNALTACVPKAQIVPSDPFIAVASGLTKAARRSFL
ncbi:Hsp70 family protein [Rhodospirillaceae bacterium KN72]|uniref:Hsp70 family protein n=1 Tax=Pacificispira spongiicola TaxID=2729598 RepID=A0A7Y0HIH1_9PROT|nr:Hsp70 family protein [Pacificispira spongiicola]NMM46554.1 Hsp70 family protein [Pacificispira spongiicola]